MQLEYILFQSVERIANLINQVPMDIGQDSVDGPNELATLALSANATKFISEVGLRQLLNVVYRVSLMKEESRYPRLVLFVLQGNPDHWNRKIVPFEDRELSTEVLHRLAPAVAPIPYALAVREGSNGLVCYAICRFAQNLGLGLQTRAVGLSIKIDGPGMLTVDTIQKQLQLRDGKAYVVETLSQSKSYQDWAAELGQRISDGASSIRVRNVWSSVLELASQDQHGGAFIVLPENQNQAATFVKVRIPACSPLLGDQIAQLSRALPESASRDEFEKLPQVVELIHTANVLARLANVDGCVVFGPRLEFMGFSAIITAESGADVKQLDCNGQVTGIVDMRRMGTRHKSAAALCANAPGTNVFVVSQDGPIRHFMSNAAAEVFMSGPFYVVRSGA